MAVVPVLKSLAFDSNRAITDFFSEPMREDTIESQ